MKLYLLICLLYLLIYITYTFYRFSISTVCDQGTTNVSAIKSLIDDKSGRSEDELKREITKFLIDGIEVIPLFDPPHLIKGIRNNLLPITKKNKKNFKKNYNFLLKFMANKKP